MKAIIRCICGREHKIEADGKNKKCGCGVQIHIEVKGDFFIPFVEADDYSKQIQEKKVRFARPKFIRWCK